MRWALRRARHRPQVRNPQSLVASNIRHRHHVTLSTISSIPYSPLRLRGYLNGGAKAMSEQQAMDEHRCGDGNSYLHKDKPLVGMTFVSGSTGMHGALNVLFWSNRSTLSKSPDILTKTLAACAILLGYVTPLPVSHTISVAPALGQT
ncbi:hypothetical protein C369_07284 [Cryptococcus neoformans A5-35-17]|nr:hypothetical protein C369_07284 [Cryptococcus neoformans var. grubii A5-35-17]